MTPLRPLALALMLAALAPAPAAAEVFFTGSTRFGVGYGLQHGDNPPRMQSLTGGDYFAGITHQFDSGWSLTLVVGIGFGYPTGHQPPENPPATPTRPRR